MINSGVANGLAGRVGVPYMKAVSLLHQPRAQLHPVAPCCMSSPFTLRLSYLKNDDNNKNKYKDHEPNNIKCKVFKQ